MRIVFSVYLHWCNNILNMVLSEYVMPNSEVEFKENLVIDHLD